MTSIDARLPDQHTIPHLKRGFQQNHIVLGTHRTEYEHFGLYSRNSFRRKVHHGNDLFADELCLGVVFGQLRRADTCPLFLKIDRQNIRRLPRLRIQLGFRNRAGSQFDFEKIIEFNCIQSVHNPNHEVD